MLKPLEKLGMRKSAIRGLETSAVYFMLNCTYSLAFWWGSINIAEGRVLVGDLLTTFWNYLNSLFSLANIVPHIAGIFDAWTAIKQVAGPSRGFELHNVTFSYPSRPNVASLKDVSVLFEPGKVTALVGPSGSGKSTITSLLLREYDPETANIPHPHDDEDAKAAQQDDSAKADANDEKPTSKSLFRKSKPKSAGIDEKDVEQTDPAADAATGLTGTEWEYLPDVDGDPQAAGYDPDRTAAIRDKVRLALQKAEAWHFVSKPAPGHGHAHLGRPHRSPFGCTIEHADKIVVLKNGRIVEQGDHDSLMEKKTTAGHTGLYRSMVMQQRHLAEYEGDSADASADAKTGSKDASSDPKSSDSTSSDASVAISDDSAAGEMLNAPDHPSLHLRLRHDRRHKDQGRRSVNCALGFRRARRAVGTRLPTPPAEQASQQPCIRQPL
ncbi:hypothetical protein L1887_55063 [Cichorium endivia]|nr:hypothetical protein L1887_55063 [Cichorium endivia]